MTLKTFQIRPVDKGDRNWVPGLLVEHWGSTKIVTRGKIYDADQLPGFTAIQVDKPVGLITYRLEGSECEIISINSLVERIGIGTALTKAVGGAAVEAGCKRIWLTTTNDNTAALRFWQKRGFSLVAVYRDAVEQSRKLKPEIPLTGEDGIPILDEIELEMLLHID
ncbi:GNAT family N-acetyltransferase [Chloroflexota bacterium]